MQDFPVAGVDSHRTPVSQHRRKLVVRTEKLTAGPASGWLSSGPPFISVGTMTPTHAPNTRDGSSFLLPPPPPKSCPL